MNVARKYQMECLIVSWVIAKSKGSSPDSHAFYFYSFARLIKHCAPLIVHCKICQVDLKQKGVSSCFRFYKCAVMLNEDSHLNMCVQTSH